jgi:hypothetical protein
MLVKSFFFAGEQHSNCDVIQRLDWKLEPATVIDWVRGFLQKASRVLPGRFARQSGHGNLEANYSQDSLHKCALFLEIVVHEKDACQFAPRILAATAFHMQCELTNVPSPGTDSLTFCFQWPAYWQRNDRNVSVIWVYVREPGISWESDSRIRRKNSSLYSSPEVQYLL